MMPSEVLSSSSKLKYVTLFHHSRACGHTFSLYLFIMYLFMKYIMYVFQYRRESLIFRCKLFNILLSIRGRGNDISHINNVYNVNYYYYNGLILPLYPVLCCFKRDFHSVSRGSRDISVLLSLFQYLFRYLFISVF